MTPWTCFSVEVTGWPFAVFMSASHWKWVGGDLLAKWQCFDGGKSSGTGGNCGPLAMTEE